MIIHSADSRGKAFHGWLTSRHTFSFAEYYDSDRMGFGALRVINDDSVAPGMGFGTHSHRDMEIISIPLEGSLEHKDSEGNQQIIKKGEVQIMSAGTGIAHSEYNHSGESPVKFLQIWVLPKIKGIKPRYEQKLFPVADRLNRWCLVVAPDGREGALTINQDAWFSLADMEGDTTLNYPLHHKGHGCYLFILNGRIELNGQVFKTRDGIGLNDMNVISLKALEHSEILLMEVPA